MGPSGSVASPTRSARRAPSARCGRYLLQEGLLRLVEVRLPRFAIEAECPPDAHQTWSQPHDKLLITAHGHVPLPPQWLRRFAVGGLVEGARFRTPTHDVRELLTSSSRSTRWPATPAGTPASRRWKWLVIAGTPGSTVYQHGVLVRHGGGDHLGALAPQRDEVRRPYARAATLSTPRCRAVSLTSSTLGTGRAGRIPALGICLLRHAPSVAPMTGKPARVLAAHQGSPARRVGAVRNRSIIDGPRDRRAVPRCCNISSRPNALAAPMHLHHDEDEYTYVLTGRIGAVLGGEEVFGDPGTSFSSLEVSGTPSGTPATSRPWCWRSSLPPDSRTLQIVRDVTEQSSLGSSSRWPPSTTATSTWDDVSADSAIRPSLLTLHDGYWSEHAGGAGNLAGGRLPSAGRLRGRGTVRSRRAVRQRHRAATHGGTSGRPSFRICPLSTGFAYRAEPRTVWQSRDIALLVEPRRST